MVLVAALTCHWSVYLSQFLRDARFKDHHFIDFKMVEFAVNGT
jgi:hypothetical protein